ncbi:MAG: hypothetical protein COT43_02685 [Candidatus Marinimicrobia bacterium CG08_land_8_20_14_0_20_45_22]|nr:MAG: hypothetical protein COT43_02685 [Candidatus Marinimicrobia bacterium CG08_land_8_20_14_0_20_45_22]
MAYYFYFHCTVCDAEVSTSGPHEFNYFEGEIVKLPHPGIHMCDGLLFNAFCLECKINREIIIVAFKNRSDPWQQKRENIHEEYLINYPEGINTETNEYYASLPFALTDMSGDDIIYTEQYRRDLTCPFCKGQNIILFPDENRKCPFCQNGILTASKYFQIT